jgi:2-polyprenyl-3-methyl-5-hydroxy-6-metoxy-1,4-benzoquinol methylase
MGILFATSHGKQSRKHTWRSDSLGMTSKGKESNMCKGAVHCPYCEGVSAYLLSSSDVNRETTADVFAYYRCLSCDILFLNPRPYDMRPFYKGGYQPIPKTLSRLRAMAKREDYRMKSLLKHKMHGQLLEIGPWIGIFSCNAKYAGFAVTAIETDPQCVDFLNNVVGVKAIQSSDPAATIDGMDQSFDVIVLWHTLEHLPNPWLVLQKAAERLAPGGILLIAVPNVESYDFSALKGAWVHLDTPRHLFFYSAQSLEKLCSTFGLQTVELTTSDRLSEILSMHAWYTRANSIIPLKCFSKVLGACMYQIAKRKSKGNGSGLTAIFVKSDSANPAKPENLLTHVPSATIFHECPPLLRQMQETWSVRSEPHGQGVLT